MKALGDIHDSIDAIDSEILALEKRIDHLKTKRVALAQQPDEGYEQLLVGDCHESLSKDDIHRYSRQLLLNDGWGVTGQIALKRATVLVIGAGGIGSSLLMYLAAAGVGTITIVDYDQVELSNIHRQVIHSEYACSKFGTKVHDHDKQGKSNGIPKVVSAKNRLLEINSCITIKAYNVQFSHDNAMSLLKEFDYNVVVDASDNPQTRYIINDACVLAGIPLVSGSAIGTEGQLTVYNYRGPKSDLEVQRSGCYRCLYPTNKRRASSADGCKSCSDNGVIGTVPGLIGILEATEVLKIITGIGSPMHNKFLMYDSLQTSFMSIKKPPSNPKCNVCGKTASITTMQDSYDQSCQTRGPHSKSRVNIDDKVPARCHITCTDYHRLRGSNKNHILLDVR